MEFSWARSIGEWQICTSRLRSERRSRRSDRYSRRRRRMMRTAARRSTKRSSRISRGVVAGSRARAGEFDERGGVDQDRGPIRQAPGFMRLFARLSQGSGVPIRRASALRINASSAPAEARSAHDDGSGVATLAVHVPERRRGGLPHGGRPAQLTDRPPRPAKRAG